MNADHEQTVTAARPIDCPNCRAKEAITYRPDILSYTCPECGASFSAAELVNYSKKLKQKQKAGRVGLVIIAISMVLLLLIAPLALVKIESEPDGAINFTAPGIEIIYRVEEENGSSLSFYLIGEYLGRWQLRGQQPGPAPGLTPTEQPTPPGDPSRPSPIPRPATLDSA